MGYGVFGDYVWLRTPFNAANVDRYAGAEAIQFIQSGQVMDLSLIHI